MNERYGKHTAPAGKTRRSAASAKPKRAIADAPSAKKSPTTTAAKRSRIVMNPSTPEFKKWRRVWWAFLILAMVLSTAAYFMWRDESLRSWGNYVLGAGYAMIFVALGIDWLKLRPMRAEWLKAGGAGKAAAKAERATSEKTAEKTSEKATEKATEKAADKTADES